MLAEFRMVSLKTIMVDDEQATRKILIKTDLAAKPGADSRSFVDRRG